MTNPGEDLLVTTEGVDEGSADSTAEGGPSTAAAGGRGTIGEPDRADQQSEATPAPPVDLGVAAPRGPGQQLEAGEG